jgi:hypothetical protein
VYRQFTSFFSHKIVQQDTESLKPFGGQKNCKFIKFCGKCQETRINNINLQQTEIKRNCWLIWSSHHIWKEQEVCILQNKWNKLHFQSKEKILFLPISRTDYKAGKSVLHFRQGFKIDGDKTWRKLVYSPQCNSQAKIDNKTISKIFKKVSIQLQLIGKCTWAQWKKRKNLCRHKKNIFFAILDNSKNILEKCFFDQTSS